MRIVAGEFRGRKLVAPEPGATRPTTDRVREAIFNALGSLDVLDGARVIDLYAGSGALGFEALSRGATHCTFVERDRAALGVIRANVAALGVGSRAHVVAGDATAVASRLAADVAFADPPYDFEGWPELLANVDASLLVAEAPVEFAADDGWEPIRAKRYGRTWVTFLQRSGTEATDD